MKYEADSKRWAADAYKVDGYDGIAWYARGWQTEPDEDTEWSGYEVRTGKVVCTMVGDDRHFAFDPEDVHALDRSAYCSVCGQMGCGHDGLDRSDEPVCLGCGGESQIDPGASLCRSCLVESVPVDQQREASELGVKS